MAVIRASQEAYKRILLTAAKDGLGIEVGLDRLLGELDIAAAKPPKEVVKEIIKETMPSFPCSICGKPNTPTPEQFKEAFKAWGCSTCVEKKTKEKHRSVNAI